VSEPRTITPEIERDIHAVLDHWDKYPATTTADRNAAAERIRAALPAPEPQDPAPSYSDEEIERAVERHWDGIKPASIGWNDLSPMVRTAYVDFAKAVLAEARPDPAKWVSREDHDEALRVGGDAAGLAVDREYARAENAERALAEARARITELEAAPAPDLRPTEEQVQMAFSVWSSGPLQVEKMRRFGWLRDTEAPPEKCTGARDCPVSEHVEGCYADHPGWPTQAMVDAISGSAYTHKVPPAPLPAEVQAVLDAAAAWREEKWPGVRPVTGVDGALDGAVRAYEATQSKEGEG
jgi:hypothetical protein